MARTGLISFAVVVGLVSGCLQRPIGQLSPQTTNVIVDKIKQTGVDKIDLLFMVDNSVSMADKQEILKDAVPDLVGRLVSPTCVDKNGALSPNQPSNPEEVCPDGYGREFQPILNINIGIITSSLGGFGARAGYSACTDPNYIDMGHMLGATNRGSLALGGSAYGDSLGFLKWRQGGTRTEFQTDFQDLISAAGEQGCGYEASLEAWYRFLVDPAPYLTLNEVSCSGGTDKNCREPSGIDQDVLDQRKAFLRPDSLVAVIMLTDENDCSVRVGGRTWVVADTGTRLYKTSSSCDTDPNGSCCYSCGVKTPTGCQADANCGDPNNTNEASDLLEETLDNANLRCFQQQRRFGIDFLYPTERYSNALSKSQLCLERPDLSMDSNCSEDQIKPNPLYTGSEDSTILPRDQSLVFLAGIVGVPWQDVAVNPSADTLTYKTFGALNQDEVWDIILGDGISPADPLMRESIAPRTGTNPATGTALAPPDSDSPTANPINGHEWDTSRLDDLQYACIFPRKSPIDCGTAADGQGCDCKGEGVDQDSRPLCQAEDGTYSPTQRYAKAYPGIRHLQVLKDYGELTGNSIVASICARNVTDPSRQDYGYRPAVGAIVDRLKEKLTDRCLPRPLKPDDELNVPCSIVEAVVPPANSACSCSANARKELLPEVEPLVRQRMAQSGVCSESGGDGITPCSAFCLCEVTQVSGDAATDCRNSEATAESTNGWCYVDPEQGVGNPALVSKCPVTARRKLRFVGDGNLVNGSTTFVACSGANLNVSVSADAGE